MVLSKMTLIVLIGLITSPLFGKTELPKVQVFNSLVQQLIFESDGGTITTDIDMRQNQVLIVDTNDPAILITSVIVEDAVGNKTTFNPCGNSECEYVISGVLSPGEYTAFVETNTSETFTGGFEVD